MTAFSILPPFAAKKFPFCDKWNCGIINHVSHSHTPKIAILFSLALEGERNMCRGILDYARRHGPWRCHLLEGRPEEQLMNLKKERFDGIIAAGGSHRENDPYVSVGVPFVLLEPRPEMLDETGASSVPYVMREIGRAHV